MIVDDPRIEPVARAICKRVLRYTHPTISEFHLEKAVEFQWREPLWTGCAKDALEAVP